jgi:hypothetical protein
MAVGSSGTGSGSQRGMRSGAAAVRQRGSYAGTQRTQDPTYILLADEKASRILPCELVLGRHAGVAEVGLSLREKAPLPGAAAARPKKIKHLARVFITIATLNMCPGKCNERRENPGAEAQMAPAPATRPRSLARGGT